MTSPLFNAAPDPTWLPWLVTMSSAISVVAIFYAQTLATRVFVLYRFKRWVPSWVVLLVGCAIALGSYFGYTVFGLGAQAALVVLTCYGVGRHVPVKSIRWININFAVFMWLIALLYAYFNTFISQVTYSFFTYHDLYPWGIDYKPLYKVFNPANDVLFKARFEFDGVQVEVAGDVDQLRSASFLAGMLTYAMCFWVLVYRSVMGRHGFAALKGRVSE